MPRQLSKSVEAYLANNGWSSSAFLEHAKHVFAELPKYGLELEVGRTVVYVKRDGNVLLKCYVHYEGRPANVLSITDGRGRLLDDFLSSVAPDVLLTMIVERCKVPEPQVLDHDSLHCGG